MERRARLSPVLRIAAGGVLPVLVAVALVPLRDDMINANVALGLMVTVVVAAALGGRIGGVVSALSYDFFLSRGQPVGRFVLVPKPGNAFSLVQRVVAVALADQVGAVLATQHLESDRRQTRYG